jgi:hypothetical protein
VIGKDHSNAPEYVEDMAGELEILRQWLESGLKKVKRTGKTQLGLAKLLGYRNNSAVAKMASGLQQIRIDQLAIIAAYIEEPIPPQFLIQPAAKSGTGEDSVFLVGKIDSSSWRLAVWQPVLKTNIPKYAENSYILAKQEAFLVDDDFCEPFARRGEYVLTVDFEEVGLLPQADDIVVTVEKRDFDGQLFIRVSMRRVVQKGRELILVPLSGPAAAIPIDAVTIRYVIGKALYNARLPHR